MGTSYLGGGMIGEQMSHKSTVSLTTYFLASVLSRGFNPCRECGQTHSRMRSSWAAGNSTKSADDLPADFVFSSRPCIGTATAVMEHFGEKRLRQIGKEKSECGMSRSARLYPISLAAAVCYFHPPRCGAKPAVNADPACCVPFRVHIFVFDAQGPPRL